MPRNEKVGQRNSFKKLKNKKDIIKASRKTPGRFDIYMEMKLGMG